jgi:hypothetical protein
MACLKHLLAVALLVVSTAVGVGGRGLKAALGWDAKKGICTQRLPSAEAGCDWECPKNSCVRSGVTCVKNFNDWCVGQSLPLKHFNFFYRLISFAPTADDIFSHFSAGISSVSCVICSSTNSLDRSWAPGCRLLDFARVVERVGVARFYALLPQAGSGDSVTQ